MHQHRGDHVEKSPQASLWIRQPAGALDELGQGPLKLDGLHVVGIDHLASVPRSEAERGDEPPQAAVFSP